MNKSLKMLRMAILAATVILGAAALFLLPDRVAVQWRDGLASNWLNKYAAVLLAIFLSGVGLYCWKASYERMKALLENLKGWRIAHTLLWSAASCLGIALELVFLMRNL